MNFSILPVSLLPYIHAALRVMTGLLFLQHGTAKILGFPALTPPPAGAMAQFTGGMELVGGILIILGLFTRPVAFILSGFMAVAYFMAHAPQNFFPILNRGELAILFSFVFLYLSVAGPGAFALDNRSAR